MDHAQEELQRKLYLNRGRVLLVDPSRSKEIQEKAHRGVWFDMPSTKFTESTIARNTRSKNPLAAGILPATWAINKLADAKAAYTTRRPPFVQQKGRLNIEKAGRIVTLADKQGRLPENVRIAEFRAHAWDKSDFFWTLDLEDTRWIVKAYGGGPQGGITYRKWLGVRDGFSEKPVAFSLKQAERGGEILPPDVVFPTKPHKKAEIDTIRLATSADTPSEGYSDLDVDEVLAAILSDEPAEIELAAKTITDDASPVIEIIDLTARPTSVPKKQLGFEKDSGGECRFELNRSKKGKKRQSDESKYDNSSAGSTSGNVRKRLCVTESSQPLEQAQERDDGINLLRFDPFKPRLDSIVTKDVVESMERASLDPEVSCKATAMNSQESCDKVQGDNDTQHIDAALKPHWSLKTEREVSHLYSVTPSPQHPANMSATVVPASPRPKWLSGRPMGRCRMIAERILADRNRVVRAAGSGCRQCAENLYECITAPGRKHCAFCTSRGSARNYFCNLATSRPRMEVSFDNIEASIVQDEDLPSIVVDNQSYGSRYFVPEITENEKVYRTSRRIADAATSRPAVPQAANMAASVERGTTITGSNLRRQSAGIFSGQQQEINASHRASSHQDEPPTSVSGPPTSPPEHTLTTHKQANTTLQVSLATDTSFVPIKLRSCTTISTFFDMVLAACDLEDQEHTIMGAEVRYAWIPNMRMMIKRKIPDSFAEMLEIVDEAPCWKEEGGGRCWVEIRVVLR